MSDEALRPGGVAVGVFTAELKLRAHTGDLARLLGLPAEAVAPGRSLADLLATVAAADGAPPCSLHCRMPDGRLLDLVVEALSDGGWSLAIIDITAAHAAAAALREARETAEAGARAKSRFLATMNHELRTPLNAVIGFAETLAHDATRASARLDPKETKEFAEHILGAGRHLLSLIDDILDLVRIDSGAYELSADTLDVARLVQGAMRGAQAAAREAGITLGAATEAGLPRLRADERRLRRLLGHLVGNALKFTRAGGRVDIEARLDRDGALLVMVRDTGVGMASEDLQRVLHSFHQLDAGLSRRAGGTGLGLQLCRVIAEAHGGGLMLESRPGQGTTATLRLPRTRLLESPPSLQLAQEPP